MPTPPDEQCAEADDFRDLTEAAESSLGFRDNRVDDEEWNLPEAV